MQKVFILAMIFSGRLVPLSYTWPGPPHFMFRPHLFAVTVESHWLVGGRFSTTHTQSLNGSRQCDIVANFLSNIAVLRQPHQVPLHRTTGFFLIIELSPFRLFSSFTRLVLFCLPNCGTEV